MTARPLYGSRFHTDSYGNRTRRMQQYSHLRIRQIAAIATAGALAVLPLLGMLISLVVWGWLATAKNLGVIHMHRPAAVIHWFSITNHRCDKDGCWNEGAPNGAFFSSWYMGLFTLYIVYQLCEGVTWCVYQLVRTARSNA